MFQIEGKITQLLGFYTLGVKVLVYALLILAGLGVLTMMIITCLDVILRYFGSPLVGAFDIVSMAGGNYDCLRSALYDCR